jgi:hypothetical protein
MVNTKIMHKSILHELMMQPLPPLGHQKRLLYRTNRAEVLSLHKLINHEIFNDELPTPMLEVAPRCREYWGMCFGQSTRIKYKKSYCKIRVMDKWFCQQWLITMLAHEMCHQYQWDVIGKERESKGMNRIMSHGPSFYIFRDKLARCGIPLKRHHRQRKWFKTQDLNKC